MNTSQRLVIAVGVLALLAMCAYPPHSGGYYGLDYNWLWGHGSIDTARLGLQFLLVAGVTGLLAYGLRPAGIQAIAKRKRLLIISVVVIVTVGTIGKACRLWGEDLYWWWYRLPPEQVCKISVKEILPDEQWLREAIVVANQQQSLVVTNGSGEALQAISIRIYYPPAVTNPGDIFDRLAAESPAPPAQGATDPLDEILSNPPVSAAPPSQAKPKLLTDEEILRQPSTSPPETSYDRLPCRVSPGGQTVVTVYIEHDYKPPLRVEVVKAWRQ